MSAIENKKLMENVFAGLATGDQKPLLRSLGENIRWHIIGETPWSGTYEGRRAVLGELLGPLTAQFATRYKNDAQRILATDDYVIVESRGRVQTRAGKSYNNTYCWVCRISDNKIQELNEYLDTELLAGLEGPPPA